MLMSLLHEFLSLHSKRQSNCNKQSLRLHIFILNIHNTHDHSHQSVLADFSSYLMFGLSIILPLEDMQINIWKIIL